MHIIILDIIIIIIIIVCIRLSSFSGKKREKEGRGGSRVRKREIDGVKNKNCWSLVIYVTRRFKCGNCTETIL